jgi:cytochrome c1
MNRNSWKIVLLALAITITLTLNLYGQQQAAPPGFKNLKVLPKDITRQQLMGYMQAFNRSLGVTCAHCHADDKSSDEKPEKDVARAMMKMMGSIKQNAAEFLPGDRAAKVSCWTCHRGSAKIEMPAPLPPPPAPPKPPQ